MAAPAGDRASSGLRVAAASALSSTVVVVLLGWSTGFRQVLHGTLLAVGAVAFLPFLVLCAALAVLLAVAVLLTLAGAGGSFLEGGAGGLLLGTEGGAGPAVRFTHTYYRLLARLRHPAWAGAALGVVLGAVLCWLLIAWLIVPREAATLTGLLSAQQQLEVKRQLDGHYPPPDAQGRFVLDGALWSDAFGTPLRYELHGVWRTQSYRLISHGADAHESADDLCVAGGAEARAVAALRAPLALLERISGSHSDWNAKLELLRRLRCPSEDR